jgi:hypothetical protein
LELYWSSHQFRLQGRRKLFLIGGGLKARAEGPRKFLNLESLKCHFLDPAAPRLLHTALGYTRKCTEWQIRITTRKSCSIFFFVRLFLHDIFLKFKLLARYFLGDSTHPPIKNQMVRPLVKLGERFTILLLCTKFKVCSTQGLCMLNIIPL